MYDGKKSNGFGFEFDSDLGRMNGCVFVRGVGVGVGVGADLDKEFFRVVVCRFCLNY